MDLLAVILLVAFCIALMFKGTWLFAGKVFLWSVVAIRWVIIVGLVFSIVNCPQTYKAMGWTPLSLLVGDQIYKKVR